MRKKYITIALISTLAIGLVAYNGGVKDMLTNTNSGKSFSIFTSSKERLAMNNSEEVITLINQLEKTSSSGIKTKTLSADSTFKKATNSHGQKNFIVSDEKLEIELDKAGELVKYTNKEIVEFVKSSSENDMKENSNLDALRKRAKDILKGLNISFYDEEKFASGIGNKYIDFTFPRSYEGYAFADDFVKVIFDKVTGEIACISKGFYSEEPRVVSVQLSEDYAREAAIGLTGKENIKSVKLLIVKQNVQNKSSSLVERLAYVVTFEDGNAIWIDAQGGTVLGGVQTK